MIYKLLLSVCILIVSSNCEAGILAHHKHLFSIFDNHRTTFFCEQPFSANGEVLLHHCKNCPPTLSKIQWMPLVPLKQLAQNFPCYQHKICVNSDGQRFKGLRCCQLIDKSYQRMRIDLYNFVPEISIIKQQRGNYVFGHSPEISAKKGCHFIVDKKHKLIEPAPSIRGWIARTYLYMKKTYGLKLSEQEYALFIQWNQQYPVSPWEREHDEKIRQIQRSSKI